MAIASSVDLARTYNGGIGTTVIIQTQQSFLVVFRIGIFRY
ncbi:MAG TPA: hypothetical protein VN517_16645 [Terriglobales bacterium]|nr:hypothetical protein [Terriglobales bacterium]